MNDTAQPIQLTIDDLDLVKNVIALACTRGAFQASEMKAIGSLYERIDIFLNAAHAQGQTQGQDEAHSDAHSHEGE